jgi:hypothetical protein
MLKNWFLFVLISHIQQNLLLRIANFPRDIPPLLTAYCGLPIPFLKTQGWIWQET